MGTFSVIAFLVLTLYDTGEVQKFSRKNHKLKRGAVNSILNVGRVFALGFFLTLVAIKIFFISFAASQISKLSLGGLEICCVV